MKILIVGLGSIAKKHIAAIRKIDSDAEIVALRSGKNAPEMEGVRNIYSLEGLDETFDFAIISNPTSYHAETVERLLPLKIPLFIEKPVFESTDYSELIQKTIESGVQTYVGCNLRFMDSLVMLHDYIRSHPEKIINEVNVYCGSYLPEWRPGTDFRKCYSSIPELGGGVNIDLIHDIDYTVWIFGNPVASRGLCRNVSSLGIRAFDYANYTLVYPRFTASIILNYYRRDYRRRIEVVFDEDTWTVDLKANEITDMNGETVYKGSVGAAQTYEAQMRYFINAVKRGERMENDVVHANEVLKICLNYERFEG